MKIAICIDKSGGILFNNRRLSQDNVVRQKLLEIIGSGKLYLNEYSSKQFDSDEHLEINEKFLSIASENDICFIENTKFQLNNISEIYIFKWNRDYPADTYFKFKANEMNFKKIHSENLAGTSHKKITLEIYRRK